MITKTVLTRTLSVFFSLLFYLTSGAQIEKSETLDVYLDCSSCDTYLIRQKIDYINYTNDPYTAQVHLFITYTPLGSGGRSYQLKMIGKQEFEGDQITLEAETAPTNTHIERQEKLMKAIELGLVSFLVKTQMQDQVSVKVNGNREEKVETPEIGKWNNWIFEFFGDLDWDKETSRETINFRYGMDIDHITPEWRIRINPSFFYRERHLENNGESILAVRRSNYFSSSVVKSISEHWSAGIFNSLSASTYGNIRLGTWLAPAVEYNIFPYTEVPFKEFTVAYSVGWRRNDYIEETIYLKTEEDLIRQMLEVALRIRQPWGNVTAGLEGSNYMDDWEKNRLEMNGRVSFRLVKGLAVSFGGYLELINDQISLPRGEATLEEILLGQRQLATAYEASVNFGLSYTFGALYNNVVNTRL